MDKVDGALCRVSSRFKKNNPQEVFLFLISRKLGYYHYLSFTSNGVINTSYFYDWDSNFIKYDQESLWKDNLLPDLYLKIAFDHISKTRRPVSDHTNLYINLNSWMGEL